jgi:hypothetical protein
MSFEILIKDMEKQYPKLLAAERINISVDSFKKNLEYFYNQGKKDGDKEGYTRAEFFYLELKKTDKKTDFGDLFGELFGKK